ncbi:MAG: hypothetical protein AAFR71_06145 [Pseudomonadota bacterium]
MRFWTFGAAVAACLSSFAPAFSQETRLPLFHGQWAVDGQHCGKPYGGEVNEGQFIVIGRGTFELYESACRITQVQQLSATDWSTVLVCQSEGESFNQNWAIKKHSPYSFTVIDGGSSGKNYKLCG